MADWLGAGEGIAIGEGWDSLSVPIQLLFDSRVPLSSELLLSHDTNLIVRTSKEFVADTGISVSTDITKYYDTLLSSSEFIQIIKRFDTKVEVSNLLTKLIDTKTLVHNPLVIRFNSEAKISNKQLKDFDTLLEVATIQNIIKSFDTKVTLKNVIEKNFDTRFVAVEGLTSTNRISYTLLVEFPEYSVFLSDEAYELLIDGGI